MSKIHFACLFGVDYDLDIMPYWTKYYTDMKLDSYHVFLHREHKPVPSDVRREFIERGFSIETLDGPHGNGILRRLALGPYAASLPPDDLLVTADADEFQGASCLAESIVIGKTRGGNTPPIAPINYRELESRYDIISGYLCDRYADRLETCFMDPFDQYFHEEPFTREVLKNFTPPFLRKTEWAYTRRPKILAARAGYDVTYTGSHSLRNVPSAARMSEDHKVLHFAWRESAKAKLTVKTYFSSDNLNEIYGGEAPDDIIQKFNRRGGGGITPPVQYRRGAGTYGYSPLPYPL